MTGPTCATGCDRPSLDAMLCKSCTYRLQRTYAEIPALLRELELTLSRQANAGGGDRIKHTKKSEYSLPFDTASSNLANAARNALSGQIRALCESRGLELPALAGRVAYRKLLVIGPVHLSCLHTSCRDMITERTPAISTADMALWLSASAQSIRQDEAAEVYFTEATTLARKLRAATDNHDTHLAGPCTAKITEAQVTTSDDGTVISMTTTERECGAKMKMRPHSPVIVCKDCGAQYDTAEQMRWALDQDPEYLARIGFIDASLVTAGYIRPGTAIKWVQRDARRRERLFYPWQNDGAGNDLFRMGDFTDYAKGIQERRLASKARRAEKTVAA
jgi:hypothetical protein